MNRTVANIVSYIFHPLLASSYIFLILLFIFPSSLALYEEKAKLQFVFAIFLMTFVVPVTSTFFLIRSLAVTSITLSDREQRHLPLVFTFVIYLITTFFCYKNVPQDPTFYFIMGFTSLVILVVFLINLFWKISSHAASFGGILAYYFIFLSFDKNIGYLPVLLLIVVVSGLVISARIALKQHTPLQTYVGFIMGFAVSYMIKFFI